MAAKSDFFLAKKRDEDIKQKINIIPVTMRKRKKKEGKMVTKAKPYLLCENMNDHGFNTFRLFYLQLSLLDL